MGKLGVLSDTLDVLKEQAKQGAKDVVKTPKNIVEGVSEQIGVKSQAEGQNPNQKAQLEAARKQSNDELVNAMYAPSEPQKSPEKKADLSEQVGLEPSKNTASAAEQAGLQANKNTATASQQVGLAPKPIELSPEKQQNLATQKQQMHQDYFQTLTQPRKKPETEERTKEAQEAEESKQQKMERLEKEEEEKKMEKKKKEEDALATMRAQQKIEKHPGASG